MKNFNALNCPHLHTCTQCVQFAGIISSLQLSISSCFAHSPVVSLSHARHFRSGCRAWHDTPFTPQWRLKSVARHLRGIDIGLAQSQSLARRQGTTLATYQAAKIHILSQYAISTFKYYLQKKYVARKKTVCRLPDTMSTAAHRLIT